MRRFLSSSSSSSSSSPALQISSLGSLWNKDASVQSVKLNGWLRTVRHQKKETFLHLYDGSDQLGLQIIADPSLLPDHLNTGCSVVVQGDLVKSPSAKSSKPYEIRASSVKLVGNADAAIYPLSKKYHSLEYLRTLPHLRNRTNTLGAVARIRNTSFMAFHEFFQNEGMINVHCPVITSSDCEGAGEMFRAIVADEKEKDESFFGTDAYLTVSGQLHAEVFASAHGK
jgi:asparaginyl-tRNA synthetase